MLDLTDFNALMHNDIFGHAFVQNGEFKNQTTYMGLGWAPVINFRARVDF